MRSIYFARTAMLVVLFASGSALAQSAQSGSVNAAVNGTYVGQAQVSQVPGSNAFGSRGDDAGVTIPTPGNNASQGRFYDENDQSVDPHTGFPQFNSPIVKDYGG